MCFQAQPGRLLYGVLNNQASTRANEAQEHVAEQATAGCNSTPTTVTASATLSRVGDLITTPTACRRRVVSPFSSLCLLLFVCFITRLLVSSLHFLFFLFLRLLILRHETNNPAFFRILPTTLHKLALPHRQLFSRTQTRTSQAAVIKKHHTRDLCLQHRQEASQPLPSRRPVQARLS